MSLVIKNQGNRARVPEHLAVCAIAVVATEVFDEVAKVDAVITSGIEGKHSHASAHYRGAALDFRTRHIKPEEAERISRIMRERLGDDFTVINESNHIHVHWEPRGAYNL